jgi:Transposase
MPRAKRKYSDDEKRYAVDLMVNHGKSAASVHREIGIPASVLRGWVREHNAWTWADAVAVHFGFLERHGFTLVEIDASWLWTWTAVYRAGEAAVLVTLDRDYSCVMMRLARAPADLPLAQRYLRVDGEVTGACYAIKLVWLRAADPERELSRVDDLGLTDPEVQAQLAFWAEVLRTYGSDFLVGDLSVLDQPDPVIRRRKRRKRRRADDGTHADTSEVKHW